MGLQWVKGGLQVLTRGYKVLERIKGDYKELQGITGGLEGVTKSQKDYKVLQGGQGGFKGLQEVTRGLREL